MSENSLQEDKALEQQVALRSREIRIDEEARAAAAEYHDAPIDDVGYSEHILDERDAEAHHRAHAARCGPRP